MNLKLKHPELGFEYQVKTAGFLAKAFLLGFKAKGFASAWDTIYILKGSEGNKRLILHELKHLEQMHKEGKLKMMLKYSWYLIKYGYWNNPYEVEARAAANK